MASYFLKIDGIAGESQDPRHPGEIEVESFSWSETYLASAASTTGAGKVHIQDLHVTKPIDKASPLLMLACAAGQHFTSAVLTALRPREASGGYLTITLSDLMVNSYQIEAPAGQPALADQPAPADRVSFSFSRIEITYRPQRPDGTLDAPVSAGWDVPADRKI